MSSQSDKVLTENPNDRLQSQLDAEMKFKQQRMAGLARKSFIMSEVRKSKDPEDIAFEKEIEFQTHQREQKERLKRVAQNRNFFDVDFWKYMFSKNIDYVSLTLMEANLLLLTYPLNTIKTRMQANHQKEDVSHFLKNNLKKKPLYMGISQGMLSLVLGNTISINIYRYIQLSLNRTMNAYNKSPFKHFQENLMAHSIGDMASLPCRIFFDAKKQFIQMAHLEYNIWQVLKACKLGFMPLLLRDTIFRITFNCVNHVLTYARYYYYWFANPNAVNIYDYEARIGSNQKVGAMLTSTLVAAVLSNPFDVVATKIMTQQYDKYTGMMDCIRTVIKEESAKKLWLSGYGMRVGFFAANGYVVLNFYPQFRGLVEEAYAVV